jgi:hypothetical protein
MTHTYRITAYPTIVFFAPGNKNVKSYFLGNKNKVEMVRWVEKNLAQKTPQGTKFDLALPSIGD